MSGPSFKFDHTKLAAAMRSISEASASVDLAHLQREVEPLFERYRAGLFPLLIMGEIKVGKSSIIDALLAAAGLVPIDADIATSIVFKVHYGPAVLYRVHFLAPDEGTPAAPPLEIPRDALESYGTENGNPANERRVDFIEVECPHPLLRSGVVLIDLPGLGGIVKNHALQVMRHLPNAAGVVYALSSQELVSDLDLQMIKRLRDRPAPPPIVFVQSKADLAGEAPSQQRRERNLQILAEATGLASGQLPYFVVSSKIRMEAEARGDAGAADAGGFGAFRAFIDEVLVPRKQDLLGLPVWMMAFDGVKERMTSLSKELQIASTSSQEALDALDRQARESRDHLEAWKRNEMDDMYMRFTDALDTAARKAEDVIAREVDPMPYGPVIGTRIEVLRDAPLSPDELADSVDDEANSLVASCDSALSRSIELFDRAASDAYADAGQTIGKVLQAPADVRLEQSDHRMGDLHPWIPNSLFEVARNSFYGGVFASGGAAWLAALVFPPAAVFAAVAGALIGGLETFRVARSRQRKAVLESVRAMLAEVNRRLHDESQKTIRRYVADVKKQMLRQMQKAIAHREDTLKQLLQEVADQRRRTIEDAQKRQLELRQKIERLATIARQLNEVHQVSGERPAAVAA
jgi:hypothetical protein